jgi:hypothetical protein
MKRVFYLAAFLIALFLNLPLFILMLFLLIGFDLNLFSGFFVFLGMNALLNLLFYLIFKNRNRDIYYSLLYGQITGVSFVGLLFTICGSILYFG